MNRYFYTFGSDPGFPYQNGWVEVRAASREEALTANSAPGSRTGLGTRAS